LFKKGPCGSGDPKHPAQHELSSAPEVVLSFYCQPKDLHIEEPKMRQVTPMQTGIGTISCGDNSNEMHHAQGYKRSCESDEALLDHSTPEGRLSMQGQNINADFSQSQPMSM
jgi:hypothetical protein